MIRILVVDDHPVVREGLTAILGDDPAVVVCGEAGTATQAIAEAERLRPDVVVLGVDRVARRPRMKNVRRPLREPRRNAVMAARPAVTTSRGRG